MNILIQIKDALALSSVLLYHIVVHLHDFRDTADLEGETVLLRELLKDRTKLRIVVAGHSREEMVL